MQNTELGKLTPLIIAQHSVNFDRLNAELLTAIELSINCGKFISCNNSLNFPVVDVEQQANQLVLICPCDQPKYKLCEHQSRVLLQIIQKDNLRIFFDEKFRHEVFKKLAVDYGLQNEANLDKYFQIDYVDHKTVTKPIKASLLSVTAESLNLMKDLMLPGQEPNFQQTSAVADDSLRCIILKQHKYYKHLMAELYDAPVTKDGKIKNPLNPVNPLELVWETNDPLELKFFTAISRFQNTVDGKVTESALESLKSIVKNPLDLPCYMHQSQLSEKITSTALLPVKLSRITHDMELTVDEKGQFYEVSGKLQIGDTIYNLAELEVRFTYFVQVLNTLYMVKDLQMLGTVNFFKRRQDDLLIHQSKYKLFQAQILDKLEERTKIDYRYVKVATLAQLKEQGFQNQVEKIIYLSDFGAHVMIVPIMRYGEVEIPIRTQRQINAVDSKGNYFTVQRNEWAERQFTALLLKQHPLFEEQLTDDLQYFYLHKKRFLNEDWFLNAFEDWQNADITILGFNEISGNKLNANKAKITVQVLSGINWFNTVIKARFGKRKASLKHLHKAIRNKSKFVQLDDGTQGILPAEWIDRFTEYFNAGEIGDNESVLTAKTNFTSIAQLYDDEMLDAEVKRELHSYKQKLADFDQIQEVEAPAGLQTTLRNYQLQGLNWLNFLDDFNFGGCLADDMGLGKTIQIIAFILSQRNKVKHNTNLLVVPTSLIFNWQAEVQKFAPSIKMHTIYGADRIKSVQNFDDYEIVLTSYGTLLADVGFLKEYQFNYIFLDESQNIKNPDSQRYKAVRLLKSRNRIAITGTPIENNTFDLYSQLSFACPGLLGSKQYFKDIYSSPIDKFKVSRRTAELQRKIKPFILRRTKQEVAAELPDKTEMLLHCEMQDEQRKIYDAYEREFREFISATTQEQLPKKSMYVLKGLTKLRQICDSPLLLSGDKLPGNASAKIEVLIEQIQSKSPRHKILVFSQFVTMLDLIAKELKTHNIGYTTLTGSTRNRENVVNDFQNNADTRVFLISLKAGGTGLNLTAADYVYLVDPWWNPAIENQAIDRAYRIGQKKNVVAVRLICPNTIEEKMMQLQETKTGLANTLISSDAGIFQSLTKSNLLALLSR
ncbi:DEAD/DEAH box helicase [Mucilaginibacter terrae]|uniref:DEAD/DEAH box helicase n=1 Tax=Mucilaginibacter terrae TaxID=1955052 RepID=UPI0036341615